MIILTSRDVQQNAEMQLFARISGLKLNLVTSFINGNQLIDLLDKYMPETFWQEYDWFNRYFTAMKREFEEVKDISAIGQKEPFPLEDIFVSLKLTEKVWERKIPEGGEKVVVHSDTLRLVVKEREKELEKRKEIPSTPIIEEQKRGRKEREEKVRIIDAEKAIKDFKKLVIVGAPGSGKTTLLKHYALKICKENLEKQERISVPIFITLREFADSGKNLNDYIDVIFERYDFPKAKDFTKKDLKDGKCHLLFDGFDELASYEKWQKVTQEIEKFLKEYCKNNIVVSSRIAGYHDELLGFTKLELLEFDDKQIRLFINNWFGKTNPTKAKEMTSAVMNTPSIKALARNPLMISITAVIFEVEYKTLPQRRVDLYDRCIEVLLNRWDVKKHISNKYFWDKKEFLLRKLAFYAHSSEKREMTEEEIMGEFKKYFPQLSLKDEDAKPLLAEIYERSYLLRQIAMDKYDFLHLSFQEYLTALEIFRENKTKILLTNFYNSWWEESILLYAGIKNDAAELIEAINQQEEDIFYNNLILTGKCVADANFTKPEIKDKVIDDLWNLYKSNQFYFIREKAITTLSFIKPERIIQEQIEILRTAKEWDVRSSAAYALGKIGTEQAVIHLIETLKSDKNRKVQNSAAEALSMIGSEQAVTPLIEILKTAKEWFVRSSAVMALGEIGSEQAVTSLIETLKTDKDGYVRNFAVRALGEIGSEQAVTPLIETLKTDRDRDIRSSAAYALNMFGSEKAVIPLIETLKTDKDEDARSSAAYALGMIGSEQAVTPLIETLKTDKDGYVRSFTVRALGMIGSEQAVTPLIETLKTDNEGGVRSSAAYALGMIGSEQAVTPLIETLKTDKDRDVRSSAAEALEKICKKNKLRILKKGLKVIRIETPKTN